ncbi:PAS domain S-box protein [SCandidatus Aminicenantes bacterium Aminicenantia_JdfR_composite]|jgi:PAS domain S-box-containing protein|nr:PAS domain S-box protein [SCandidatus Aminicenantes bacterium Aminicenantia_JdfR_composite]MCP2597936.1 PAS domain S-box protein [Candidatus Aminicenantes bacterium AC-335-L06]MCP2606082.1 PAS domain S-box protein [Candidatus Aminicenantes bacterium AC-708-I09]MCP2620883.1 PAS domain S-box protein [Candidatus Aminicenantes bacterium AC-334-E05]
MNTKNEKLKEKISDLENQIKELKILQRESNKERKKIEHLNNVLRAIRKVNQLITREKRGEQLLQKACEILLKIKNYSCVCIFINGKIYRAGDEKEFQKFLKFKKKIGEESGLFKFNSFYLSSIKTKRNDINISLFILSEKELSREENKLLEEISEDIVFGLYLIKLEKERKEFEEKLKESENMFRSLAEESLAGIYLIQGNKFKYVNPKLAEIFGYKVEELIDKMGPKELVFPDDWPIVRKNLEKRLKGEIKSIQYEFRGLTKDKRTIYVEVYGSAVQYQGKPAVIGTLLDVTERKRAEDILRKTEENLRFVLKMEALGRFAGNIAHDFKNFLTVIMGYSELILSNLSKQNPIYKYARLIYETSNEAISLVQKLLALGRKQVFQPKILNLNELIKDMEGMIKTLVGEDIALVLELDPKLRKVKVDRDQIEQVIINLISNARDAMPKGGTITIKTSNVNVNEEFARQIEGLNPGPYIMLIVKDTGIGMNRHIISHIFEPYFTTKENGTGLGLSTVYGIIRQSGGQILVQSEPGKGATFIIYLPQISDN